MRLDQHLFQEGFVESREKARALIMEGLVYLNGEKSTKAGLKVPADAQIEVRGNSIAYVSRGGLKLEKALESFSIVPKEYICMDIGASTGGFTDCLLQNGAQKVYSIDVGYGQLAWKLRCDDRVVVMERCNVRHLKEEDIPDSIDFFSIDVSFISLKLIFPAILPMIRDDGYGVCLIKPQFEAGKENVGKNGVVKDITVHKNVISQCIGYATECGFSAKGLDFSPIKGPKGNMEFLLYLQKNNDETEINDELIEQICSAAHAHL